MQRPSLHRDGERAGKDRQQPDVGIEIVYEDDARCDVIDALNYWGTGYIIGGRKRYGGNGRPSGDI